MQEDRKPQTAQKFACVLQQDVAVRPYRLYIPLHGQSCILDREDPLKEIMKDCRELNFADPFGNLRLKKRGALFFLLEDRTKSQYVCCVESSEAVDIKNILNYGNVNFSPAATITEIKQITALSLQPPVLPLPPSRKSRRQIRPRAVVCAECSDLFSLDRRKADVQQSVVSLKHQTKREVSEGGRRTHQRRL